MQVPNVIATTKATPELVATGVQVVIQPRVIAAGPPGLNGKDGVDGTGGGASAVTSVAGRQGDVTLAKTDVGLGNVDNTSDASKPVSGPQATAIGLKADASATTTALGTKEATANKGQANGYAGLDGGGKVPAAQLPAYVDDVLEYANLAAFPGTGSAGLIYVTLDTNKTYRWSGSVYTEISPSDVNSVAGRTGVVVLTKADVALSNVDNTSDANKPISTATATAFTQSNLKALAFAVALGN